MIVGVGYFSYDYIRGKTSVQDVEREEIKKLVESEPGDKKSRRLNRYIS